MHKDHVPYIHPELREFIERAWPQDERPDPKASDRDRWIREGELKAMRVLVEAAKRQEKGGQTKQPIKKHTVVNPSVEIGME